MSAVDWLRRIVPRSLAARLVVLLLVSLLASQALIVLIFSDERRWAVHREHRAQLLPQIAVVVRLLRSTPPSTHDAVVAAATTRRLRYGLADESAIGADDLPRAADFLMDRLNRMTDGAVREVRLRLDQRGREPSLWDRLAEFIDDDHDDESSGHRRHRHHRRPVWVKLSVHRVDGGWLNVDTILPPPRSPWPRLGLISFVISAIVITLVVVVMVRRISRPMQRLADAADRLGRGEDVSALPEAGPEEVRRTTRAFNRMRERLARFVSDRTEMLAAISHDLRTPITTLRLRAEFVEDAETRTRLLATLDEMQQMTEATLAFARDQATEEPSRTVELSALIESLVDDLADLGWPVTVEEAERLPYACRPIALKRAIRNVIDNAVTYGHRAVVSMTVEADTIAIHIDDDGPGIPADSQQRMFEPFVRMDASRSRETGGVGLGLAIARTIVRGHGGDITLQNRDPGLRVSIRLPREQSAP
jgi:signal transduction histidine kinase